MKYIDDGMDSVSKAEYEKLLRAFQKYVEQDAFATESAYVVTVLRDNCLLSNDDIVDYGLGWLLYTL